jgi:mannose-6-phosphate isomerase-like protein (cupin superfamily)
MLCLSVSWAQDPVDVSPQYYKALFENDMVRVLEMRLPPGSEDAMHEHPTETVYFVSGGNLKITLPQGDELQKEVIAGEVMFHDAWTHRVKNIGTSEVQAIIVELKESTGTSGRLQ